MKKNNSGMSLIEILVVIGVFAVLGVLTTRAIILSISGGKKSENLIRVRENLNYSLSIMERQLRNANSVNPCPNTDPHTLTYYDQNGVSTSFSCKNISSGIGYVASGSARLTADTIDVTSCNITCQNTVAGNPSSVKITIEAKDTNAAGSAQSTVSSTTEVFLRNY